WTGERRCGISREQRKRTALGLPRATLRPFDARRCRDWDRRTPPQRGAALYGTTGRPAPDLCRSGRDRHREYAAAQRTPRIAAAAEGHRRRTQGHQPLEFRSPSGARYADRVGGTILRGANGRDYAPEVHRLLLLRDELWHQR